MHISMRHGAVCYTVTGSCRSRNRSKREKESAVIETITNQITLEWVDGLRFEGRAGNAVVAALTACRRLDRDSALTGGISARGDGLEFMVNDRLLAPNTPETFAEVQPDLEAALAEPLGERNFFLAPAGESRGRFTVKIVLQTPFDLSDLLERLN